MFATALIVFRESLEAALFVGIIAAATQHLAGRIRWLSGGVAAGALGAVLLALAARTLSEALDGIGQDLVNIGVLTLALLMLLWHCIWVSNHTREMVAEAKFLGHEVQSGQRRPWALMVAVALAVLREGAETVLFVSGSLSGSEAPVAQVVLSGALGLGLGVAAGAVIYAGLARVPTRHIFSVTNTLIALLAASLASQLVRALVQAGLLNLGTETLWDSSWLLTQESALGTLLHALVGYDAQPMAVQGLAYVATLAAIYLGSRALRRGHPAPAPVAVAAPR